MRDSLRRVLGVSKIDHGIVNGNVISKPSTNRGFWWFLRTAQEFWWIWPTFEEHMVETRDSNWWFKLVQIRDVDFNKKTTKMWTPPAKMWIWRTAYGDAGYLCDQVTVGPTSQAWDTTWFVSKHPGDHIFCCCLSCLSSKWSNFNRYRNAVILENLGWSILYPSPTLLRAAPSWEIIEANGGFSSKPCLITRGEPSLWGHNGDIMQT